MIPEPAPRSCSAGVMAFPSVMAITYLSSFRPGHPPGRSYGWPASPPSSYRRGCSSCRPRGGLPSPAAPPCPPASPSLDGRHSVPPAWRSGPAATCTCSPAGSHGPSSHLPGEDRAEDGVEVQASGGYLAVREEPHLVRPGRQEIMAGFVEDLHPVLSIDTDPVNQVSAIILHPPPMRCPIDLRRIVREAGKTGCRARQLAELDFAALHVHRHQFSAHAVPEAEARSGARHGLDH